MMQVEASRARKMHFKRTEENFEERETVHWRESAVDKSFFCAKMTRKMISFHQNASISKDYTWFSVKFGLFNT